MTASSLPPPAPGLVAGRRLGLVFVGLMLGMLLAALDQTIVATALPTIVGERTRRQDADRSRTRRAAVNAGPCAGGQTAGA